MVWKHIAITFFCLVHGIGAWGQVRCSEVFARNEFVFSELASLRRAYDSATSSSSTIIKALESDFHSRFRDLSEKFGEKEVKIRLREKLKKNFLSAEKINLDQRHRLLKRRYIKRILPSWTLDTKKIPFETGFQDTTSGKNARAWPSDFNLAFSKDEKWVVALSESGGVVLRHLFSGREYLLFKRDGSRRRASFHPNGKILLIQTDKGHVTLFRLEKNTDIRKLSEDSLSNQNAGGWAIYKTEWGADSDDLYILASSGQLSKIRGSSGKIEKVLVESGQGQWNGNRVNSHSLDPTKSVGFALENITSPVTIDLKTGKVERIPGLPALNQYKVGCSDHQTVVLIDTDKAVAINLQKRTSHIFAGRWAGLELSPDGSLLALQGRDATGTIVVEIRNVENGEIEAKVDLPNYYSPNKKSLAFSQDGTRLFAAVHAGENGQEAEIHVIDIPNNRTENTVPMRIDALQSMARAPGSSETIVIKGEKGTQILDLAYGVDVATGDEALGNAQTMHLSPRGDGLFTLSSEMPARLISLHQRDREQPLNAMTSAPVQPSAWSESGRYFAYRNSAGDIELLKVIWSAE